MLNMELDLNFKEEYSDSENQLTKDLAKSLQQQVL